MIFIINYFYYPSRIVIYSFFYCHNIKFNQTIDANKLPPFYYFLKTKRTPTIEEATEKVLTE